MTVFNDLEVANRSGFPFQLALQDIIDTGQWHFIKEEYPWLDTSTGEAGFIDLLLGGATNDGRGVRVLLEAKKVTEGRLVFLQPQDDANNDGYEHILVRNTIGRLQWSRRYVNPPSQVSSYCTISKKGSNPDHQMLEKTCRELLRSVEAFAEMEQGLDDIPNRVNKGLNIRFTLYVPVIVTNAELRILKFKRAEVDLVKGEIPVGSGQSEPVPYLRFRKSFGTKHSTGNPIQSLAAFAEEGQRSIFVVSVGSLRDFLQQLGLG
jgi:hypothetical protein